MLLKYVWKLKKNNYLKKKIKHKKQLNKQNK